MKNPTGNPAIARIIPIHITTQTEAKALIPATTRPTRTQITRPHAAGELPWLGDSSWVGSFKIRPYSSTWSSLVMSVISVLPFFRQSISGSLKLLAMIRVLFCQLFFTLTLEHELLRDFRSGLRHGTIRPTYQSRQVGHRDPQLSDRLAHIFLSYQRANVIRISASRAVQGALIVLRVLSARAATTHQCCRQYLPYR